MESRTRVILVARPDWSILNPGASFCFSHIFSGLLGKVGQRYRQFKSDSDRLAQKIRVVAVLEIGASQRTTDQRAITGRQHRASIGISIAPGEAARDGLNGREIMPLVVVSFRPAPQLLRHFIILYIL
jgi:hypothetical protein